MSTIYNKSLKGVEEVALRSKGLQLRLRAYLILVDGNKSTDEIQYLNPSLPEVTMVLSALLDEGYIEVVGERTGTASLAERPQSAPINAPKPPPQQYRAEDIFPTTQSETNNQFLQARDSMQREIMVLLGKDAEMVISKIQRCDNGMDLFAMMMGLKKIITMYANNEKAEQFATKFSYVATL